MLPKGQKLKNMLSKKSLEVLRVLFAESSNLNLPVGVAVEIVEIREWVSKQMEQGGKVDKS